MKKYICIVKTKETFLKYNVTDLLSFTNFLDRFHQWHYYNVYNKQTGEQVGSYTVNNKPTSKRI